MDPLHPLVPVQPPAPPRPEYNRVQRIERDQERGSSPDWERDSDGESDGEPERRFEDDYDPDWTEPTTAEPYGPDGARQDGADPARAEGLNLPVEDAPLARPWDPRVDGERRSHPRKGDAPTGEEPGPHIDISA